ncbi:helix-turn-helix domain-containing protein [Olivibacter sp. XZL3]|uniref:helix-turn-helix transcriptional regulator n=1 Tax=Olivibacter sp. XZL3 TaxID=1735116 RepID=UPI001066FA3E|nr:helix-turn-helix domain-containing protein [Olivibacter sp. XZL3]
MVKPVLIDLPTDKESDILHGERLPATTSQRLALAAINYWQNRQFSVIEQYYDAPDAFICLAEVDSTFPLQLELRFQRSDLYWLYQLQGQHRIHCIDRLAQQVLQTKEAHYTQAYIPAGKYTVHFAGGRHQLFYFVIKANWLRRYGRRSMEGFNHLLDSQRAQQQEAQHNQFCPIHEEIHKQLLSLFTLPKVKRFHYDLLIYKHCFALLDLSQEELKRKNASASKNKDPLTSIRNYIKEQIPKGNLISIAAIAAFFKVNYRTLRRQHYQIYGYSLAEFIQQKRMEQAADLLVHTDMPIKEIAHFLGYTVNTSFHQRFKRHYGISPSSYRLRHLKTPPAK